MENLNEKVRPMDEDRLSMISRMSQAVGGIPRRDLVTLISALANPPADDKDALDAVLGYNPTEMNWQTAKKLMTVLGPDSHQKRVAAVDPESVPENRRKRVMDILFKHDVERMNTICKAVGSFYEWVLAVSKDYFKHDLDPDMTLYV